MQAAPGPEFGHGAAPLGTSMRSMSLYPTAGVGLGMIPRSSADAIMALGALRDDVGTPPVTAARATICAVTEMKAMSTAATGCGFRPRLDTRLVGGRWALPLGAHPHGKHSLGHRKVTSRVPTSRPQPG